MSIKINILVFFLWTTIFSSEINKKISIDYQLTPFKHSQQLLQYIDNKHLNIYLNLIYRQTSY